LDSADLRLVTVPFLTGRSGHGLVAMAGALNYTFAISIILLSDGIPSLQGFAKD